MHEIKLDPLPIVTGDPDELLDLDICDTCEFATTQAARIAAICEQVKRYTVTRYIAPGRQIIVAPSTRTPGGWQVTFYHAHRPRRPGHRRRSCRRDSIQLHRRGCRGLTERKGERTMKKFNNIFEQINVELPAVWKIQTLRTEIRLSPCKAAELQPQIDAARLTIICARRGYLYTA